MADACDRHPARTPRCAGDRAVRWGHGVAPRADRPQGHAALRPRRRLGVRGDPRAAGRRPRGGQGAGRPGRGRRLALPRHRGADPPAVDRGRDHVAQPAPLLGHRHPHAARPRTQRRPGRARGPTRRPWPRRRALGPQPWPARADGRSGGPHVAGNHRCLRRAPARRVVTGRRPRRRDGRPPRQPDRRGRGRHHAAARRRRVGPPRPLLRAVRRPRRQPGQAGRRLGPHHTTVGDSPS
jgi:hypothetical protein